MTTGMFGATRLGNTQLVDYGIQNEDSDIRVHVCVEARHVYVFETSLGKDAVESGRYPLKPTWTGDIKTAEGYLVPPSDLDAKVYKIPNDIFAKANFGNSQHGSQTSDKGEKAVMLVRDMIKSGDIPINLEIKSVDSRAEQIRGLDVSVRANINIQVKCDWKGGSKHLGGTGNLYLQVRECNPERQY